MKNKWRLSYDAPVTLTFTFICTVILVLCLYFPSEKARRILTALFTAPSRQGTPTAFNYKSVFDYMRLFIYVFGHADWTHLLSNMSFILLLGPLMEERYGSGILVVMTAVTALIASVINVCILPYTMHGASGIVFMLIILTAFTSFDKKQIPLSALLVLALYIGRELISTSDSSNVAAFAHITGGLCGALFGFFISPRRRASSRAARNEIEVTEYDDSSDSPKTKKRSTLDDVKKRQKRLDEIDSQSPRRKSAKTKRSTKDEVVGELDF